METLQSSSDDMIQNGNMFQGGKENMDYEMESGISKRQLHNKIQQIAIKESRPPDYTKLFYVHKEILQQYGVSHLQSVSVTPNSISLNEGCRVMDSSVATTPRKRALTLPLDTLLNTRESAPETEKSNRNDFVDECVQESSIPPEKKQKLNSVEL